MLYLRKAQAAGPPAAAAKKGVRALKKLLCAALAASLGLACAACAQESGGLFASSRPDSVESAELQFQTPAADAPAAVIRTSLGSITVVLYPQYAPLAVENFTGLAQQGYYDGLVFHRVEHDFVIQTGDATGTGASGATVWDNEPFPNEVTGLLRHDAGALATANADASQGNLSQFYIVSAPAGSVDADAADTLLSAGLSEDAANTYRQAGGAPYLDGLDTVFGQVVDGMDVVDAINAVETDENSRPLEDVTVLGVTVTTFGQAGAIAAESAPESAA